MKSDEWKGCHATVKDRRERAGTIPKKIRDVLEVQPGDTVCYLVEQDSVRIKKMDSIKDIKGMGEYDGLSIDVSPLRSDRLEFEGGQVQLG